MTKYFLWAMAVVLLTIQVGHADVDELSLDEFKKLHQQLQPPKEELWRQIPWQTSVLEARALAIKDKKPLFMVVRSGYPLGCG